MNIVVDSNVIISILIKPGGIIFDLFDRLSEENILHISDTTLAELLKHHKKIFQASKQNINEFENLKITLLQKVNIIPSSFISDEILIEAYQLVKEVDENDFAFVAATIFVEGLLWTGDKKLYNALKKNGFNYVLNSNEIKILLNYE